MSPSSFFPILLIILVSSLADADTIEQTCRKAALRQQGFNYQLCVDSIKSDPMNPGTNVEFQAAAAVNQAEIRAETAWNKASSSLRRDPSITPILNQCVTTYNDVRGSVSTALDLLQNDLKVPARKAALDELMGARERSQDCPNAFSKAGKPSPLAQESTDATDMLVIAVAVLGLLVP